MNESMTRAAIAGTRAAYDPCPDCGCARIRHPIQPGGRCAGTKWGTASGYGKSGLPMPVRCSCARTADSITEEE